MTNAIGVNENDLANAIRSLSLDAICNAKSGHQGAVMGMADIFTILYKNFLNFDPQNPKWQDRDRIVLSNGHASMILYSTLFLTGYEDISIDDIKNFRKINSKTSGHPEFGEIEGIECSTGPLGQGIANAVGMALSLKMSNSSAKVYCFVGDGCLMEGISQEAISFANQYKLDNLIIIFDNNSITIDGTTDISTNENNTERFKALNFNVIEIDGHNAKEINNAFEITTSINNKRPNFINAKTTIGIGTSVAGTTKAHGSVVEVEEAVNFRKSIHYPENLFEVPNNILSQWRSFYKRCNVYNKTSEDKKQKLKQSIDLDIQNLHKQKEQIISKNDQLYTRKSLQGILSKLNSDSFIYGSADLLSSTASAPELKIDTTGDNFVGNYINFGIREHAMAAISNGIALCGDKIPVISTFLAFSDYLKPALRMSAFMKQQVVYVFTHDSITLGQDGPTHQPVEHLTSLRSIPNLLTIRPCNDIEIIEGLEIALRHKGPIAIILSKPDIKTKAINIYNSDQNSTENGGYYISKTKANTDITLYSSGYEVGLCFSVAEILQTQYNKTVNIVSIPCFTLFDKQDEIYKNSVISKNSFNVVIEYSDAVHYYKYINNSNGIVINLTKFGLSGSPEDVISAFNLDANSIAKQIIERLKNSTDRTCFLEIV